VAVGSSVAVGIAIWGKGILEGVGCTVGAPQPARKLMRMTVTIIRLAITKGKPLSPSGIPKRVKQVVGKGHH
jgi:hypothetical protein